MISDSPHEGIHKVSINKQHNNKFDYLSCKPFKFSWNLFLFMLWLHWPQTAFITRMFEEKYALNRIRRILSPSQRVWSLVVQQHSWATGWYLAKKHCFFPFYNFLMLVLFLSFVTFRETHVSNTTWHIYTIIL